MKSIFYLVKRIVKENEGKRMINQKMSTSIMGCAAYNDETKKVISIGESILGIISYKKNKRMRKNRKQWGIQVRI